LSSVALVTGSSGSVGSETVECLDLRDRRAMHDLVAEVRQDLVGKKLDSEYVDEPRRGDRICYTGDLACFHHDYPDRELTVGLDAVFEQFVQRPVSAT
jgi:hypothetical protein